MIDAEIRRKIRSNTPISEQEDILTSNVFGLMRMVPESLIEILSKAKHMTKDETLSILHKKMRANSFKLWESFNNTNKNNAHMYDYPDVYFELETGENVIVEVKYYSPESRVDQLKDYASHCTYLVYLTHFNNHQVDAKDKYKNENNIYLLTWKEFHQALLEKTSQSAISSIEMDLLRHVQQYLNYKFPLWNGWTESFGLTTYLDGGFYSAK